MAWFSLEFWGKESYVASDLIDFSNLAVIESFLLKKFMKVEKVS